MNDSTINNGNRIKAGREYGTARLATAHGVWYHADETGKYKYATYDTVERVHGNKHKPKEKGAWPA